MAWRSWSSPREAAAQRISSSLMPASARSSDRSTSTSERSTSSNTGFTAAPSFWACEWSGRQRGTQWLNPPPTATCRETQRPHKQSVIRPGSPSRTSTRAIQLCAAIGQRPTPRAPTSQRKKGRIWRHQPLAAVASPEPGPSHEQVARFHLRCFLSPLSSRWGSRCTRPKAGDG